MRKLLYFAISLLILSSVVGCTNSAKSKNESTTEYKFEKNLIEESETDDLLGSIHGVNIQPTGNDFSKTFGAEGFLMDNVSDSDGVPCYSKKYSSTTCIVYGAGISSVSPKDIQENGFCGYDIERGAKENPKMTWNGCTWGATTKEIINAYGKPSEKNDEDTYTELIYRFSSGAELTFIVRKEMRKDRIPLGLQSVKLNVFDPSIELFSSPHALPEESTGIIDYLEE